MSEIKLKGTPRREGTREKGKWMAILKNRRGEG